MPDTNDREMGVELGDLNDDLEAHDYPASSEELIEEYGDRELDLPKGSKSFDEVMEPVSEKTYEEADGVRQDIFNFVGSDAVGRENYSDRGAAADKVEGEEEPESL